MSAGGGSGVGGVGTRAVGRRLAEGISQCMPEAKAYGQCCLGLGREISKGACSKEFAALAQCFKKSRGKA